MTTGSWPTKRVAVLIDAENVGPKDAVQAMKLVVPHGHATVRRAYRPWTDAARATWMPTLDSHGIVPVHVEPGPNQVDMALAIDAMDLIHGGRIEGLCIVSSDGDFTPLAQRAREHGLHVIAIGMKPATRLASVCDHVVTLAKSSQAESKPATKPRPPDEGQFAQAVREGIRAAKQDDGGWCLVAHVGQGIRKDLKSGAFVKQIEACGVFEVRRRKFNGSGSDVPCVREAPAGEG